MIVASMYMNRPHWTKFEINLFFVCLKYNGSCSYKD